MHHLRYQNTSLLKVLKKFELFLLSIPECIDIILDPKYYQPVIATTFSLKAEVSI